MAYTLEQQKANRKKWVKALRSGKYRQAKNNLVDSGGYCCLGVLAKVRGVSDKRLAGQNCLALFPHLMRAVGLRDNEGGFELVDGCETEYLSNLNDSGVSFAEIADIIESEPPGLFAESV